MPLQPAVSFLARKTIRTAYDQLNQIILPRDSCDFKSLTLEYVRNSALAIEDQLASRRSLRNMRRLLPLFNGLEHYGNVISVLCNGTPYLSWIWAPIALILRISCEYVEAFEQIIKAYSGIAESLQRFEILNKALRTNSDFQETVAVFYADILLFHEHAYKFVRRNGMFVVFLRDRDKY